MLNCLLNKPTRVLFHLSVWIFLGIFAVGCATVGPEVTSSEISGKQAELEVKAARYKETQLNRVKLITSRLTQFMPPEAQNKISGIKVEVSDSADINASASFTKLTVNYGMLRFIESDDQLAAVISHELAHIIKGHVQKNLATTIVAGAVGMTAGAAVDSLGGGGIGGVVSQGVSQGMSASFTRDFEREADYYGLQYMYVAGFDVLEGIEIWERFAIEAPKTMTQSLFSTHPSSPERLVRAEKVLQELSVQGIAPNLFKTSSAAMSLPKVVSPHVAVLGFNGAASNNQNQSSAQSAEAQQELQSLKEEITKLKKEQEELQKNVSQQQKIKYEQTLLEQALDEAKEASRQLRYEEFGIQDIGLAKKATNLFIAKKVTGEQRIFSINQGSVDWFVQYRPYSRNSLKALVAIRRKYHVYWYSPDKHVYSEQDFGQAETRADFAKTTLQWDVDLGDFVIGEWRVRIFEDAKLIDERTFEVIR